MDGQMTGRWDQANRVDLAALAVQMGLPIDTYTQPVRIKCPFHHDGDSFNLTVHKTGTTWSTPHVYCYSCEYSGSAIDFVRDYLQMSEREAVDYILGRPLPKVTYTKPSQERPIRDMTDAFVRCNERLLSQDGASARRYLEGRGIEEDTIHALMLGVWWDDSSRWSGRLTIPHLRLDGEPIVAGKGRTMTGAEPKYLATSGASQNTYLSERTLSLPDTEPIILCEGEMDAISLYQAGWQAVCAVPGVRNFRDEFRFMGRRVYVILDNDEAGRKARDGEWIQRSDERIWRPGIIDRLSEVSAYPLVIHPQLGDINEMLMAYGAEGLSAWLSEEIAMVEGQDVFR